MRVSSKGSCAELPPINELELGELSDSRDSLASSQDSFSDGGFVVTSPVVQKWIVHPFYGLICRTSDGFALLNNPFGCKYREENGRMIEQSQKAELPQSIFEGISALLAGVSPRSRLSDSTACGEKRIFVKEWTELLKALVVVLSSGITQVFFEDGYEL